MCPFPTDAYYHEMFLRGLPHLSAKMKRPSSKSILAKGQLDSSDPTPDFYAVSHVQPLPEPDFAKGPPPMDGVMQPDKVSDSEDQSNAANNTDGSQFQETKYEVVDHIAQLLNKHSNTQQQTSPATPNFDNTEVLKILSLLNRGQGCVAAAAPVVPAQVSAAPQNQHLQQLLAGFYGINDSQTLVSSTPQAQMLVLLQKQMQLQQQQQQPNQPNITEAMLAMLLRQNQKKVVDQADLLSILTNQMQAQNGNQNNIPSAIMNNSGGQNNNQLNHVNLLQALSVGLQHSQQQSSFARSQKSSQSQQKHQCTQESSKEQASEVEGWRKHRTEDSSASQRYEKRQRQSYDKDISTTRLSTQGSTSTSSSSSSRPNMDTLLGQLTGGQNGGAQSNAVAVALSPLISLMSQKDVPSSKPSPLDILNMLRQAPCPQQQQKFQHKDILSNMLSILQQQGYQNGYVGARITPKTPTEVLISALQQQVINRAQQGQDPVTGLLQQLLNHLHNQHAQSIDSSTWGAGNPVLDALHSLTTPAQSAAASSLNNTLSQLQQLLAGQNQVHDQQAPVPVADMRQQPSRNNGSENINVEILSSLGLKNDNECSNNPAAAILRQFLNSNFSKQSINQQHFDGSSRPTIDAESLTRQGLLNNQSTGTNIPNQARAQSTSQKSGSKPQQAGLNPEFLASLGLSQSDDSSGLGSGKDDRTSAFTSGASGAPSGQSSSKSCASLNSDVFDTDASSQNQGQTSRNQENNESTILSVAAILSAFNQGSNRGS